MALPQTFSSELATRGQQNRRVRVGNPYAYLAAVGIGAVLEHIYRGANLVDVAEALDVSVTLLRTWVEAEGHGSEVDAAVTTSAEGYLSRGRQLLANAANDFDLKKGKAMIEHSRWLASKLDKPTYGSNDVQAAPTTVSYTFNVGDSAQIIAAVPHALQGRADAMSAYMPPIEFNAILPAYNPDVVGEESDAIQPDGLGPFTEAPSPLAASFLDFPEELLA